MQLNISYAQAIRTARQKILRKRFTTYRTNLKTPTLQEQAREFRQSFGIGKTNTRKDRERQKNLIVEEFKEFLEAENMLFRNSVGYHTDTLKELADLVYVCYQYAEQMKWNLDESMNRVHLSNMSKLDDDGNPIYREDGKVLKGPHYQPPNLRDLI